MESALYAISDIFGHEFPLDIQGDNGGSKDGASPKSTVILKKIVIPMLQRDYAQGRTDKDTTRKRKNFLSAIYDAVVDNKEPLVLDFVYGDITTDGQMTPLDGQQRLTTLFLLNWYAACKCSAPKEDRSFLCNFSYQTRPNARDFCKALVCFDFTQCSGGNSLKVVIKDQTWFQYDWAEDATVKSMLEMLEAIDEKFCKVGDLWQRLVTKKRVVFYFLPIKNMGLTDDIYIKMNSRGKELTDFENFKAEFEKYIEEAAGKEVSDEIAQKIDTTWTDLLWHYQHPDLSQYENGDACIIDDDFLRYFKFVCSIICYENGDEWDASQDWHDLLQRYFVPQIPSAATSDESELAVPTKEQVLDNIRRLQRYFDIWCEATTSASNPAAVFATIFSATPCTKSKVCIDILSHELDIFEQCIKHFDEPSFTLAKFLLLYAALLYLTHKSEFSASTIFTRFRVLRNLIQNSDDRMREESMSALLKQTSILILSDDLAKVGDIKGGFNGEQLAEEQQKIAWLQDNPALSQNLYDLEEHNLLYGKIAAVGLDNVAMCPRFYELFECDRDKVGCALLAIGDYRQDCGWQNLGQQYRIGARNETSWKALLHQNSRTIARVQKVLLPLLQQTTPISKAYLDKVIRQYLQNCEKKHAYDWRYYYIKYSEFRKGCNYGLYRFNHADCGSYEITATTNETRFTTTSTWSPFLVAICNRLNEGSNKSNDGDERRNNNNKEESDAVNKAGNSTEEEIARVHGDFNNELSIGDSVITIQNSTFTIKSTGKAEQIIDIPQIKPNKQDSIDTTDRVEYIANYCKSTFLEKTRQSYE